MQNLVQEQESLTEHNPAGTVPVYNFPAAQTDLTGLLRLLRMEYDPDDENIKRVEELYEQALAIARPGYSYQLMALEAKTKDSVLIGDNWIQSPLVRANLDQTKRAVPYLATCGRALYDWSMAITDFFDRFIADQIKIHFLDQAFRRLKAEVKGKYFPRSDLSQMNPGSLPDWPLSGQGVLFTLMAAPARRLDIALTDSFLMIPDKSVSGLFFSAEEHFENCRFCPRENCPSRRVPYRPPN